MPHLRIGFATQLWELIHVISYAQYIIYYRMPIPFFVNQVGTQAEVIHFTYTARCDMKTCISFQDTSGSHVLSMIQSLHMGLKKHRLWVIHLFQTLQDQASPEYH